MKYELHTAFGWKIHKVTALAGEQFDLGTKREAAPNRLTAQTLFTKGLITGFSSENESFRALNRVPGFGNDNLPNPVPHVNMKMTVEQDAEWWCVSVPTNASLPTVTFVRGAPEQLLPLSIGDLILVCSGSGVINEKFINAPAAIRITTNTNLLCGSEGLYAMKFDKDKDEK